MMMLKPIEHENVIMDYPAVPPIDDGARMRLRAIINFFDTRCEGCTSHYCAECTARLEQILLESLAYLESTDN
jgi:hypothetical protein